MSQKSVQKICNSIKEILPLIPPENKPEFGTGDRFEISCWVWWFYIGLEPFFPLEGCPRQDAKSEINTEI